MPGDIASRNLKLGPQDESGFRPEAVVTCDYVEKKQTGTPKFDCAISPDDTIRVKYGEQNGEVYSEVAASRLLWALGFGADRMYPVKVVCKGCPADPMKNSQESRRHARVRGRRRRAQAARRRHRAAQGLGLGMGRADVRRSDERRRAARAARRAEAARGDDSAHRQQAAAAAACVPRQGPTACRPQEDGTLQASVHDDQRPRQDLRHAPRMFNERQEERRQFQGVVRTRRCGRTRRLRRAAVEVIYRLARASEDQRGRPQIPLRPAGATDRSTAAGSVRGRALHRSAIRTSSIDDWVRVFKQKRDEIANARCANPVL